MNCLTAICTDVGIVKETNQDSICLKQAHTRLGMIVMGVICDGMGGLSKGEVASAAVIKAFSQWFDEELPLMMNSFSLKDVEERWNIIIKELNFKIGEYGRSLNTHLGTTITALLLVETGGMIIGHVGDTRAYKIIDRIELLTEDQTVVGREVRRGNMTEMEAENDPRSNVLLQCIGASKSVTPDFYVGVVESGCTYVLCSDGFRHRITADEIFDNFQPRRLVTEDIMSERACSLVSENKKRLEKDNISVLLIRTL